MTVPRGNDTDRLVRSIWEKDSPEMLALVRPRLVREVRALEAQWAATTTEGKPPLPWPESEDAEAHAAIVQARLAEARYYLALFDDVVRVRGLTLVVEGQGGPHDP
jgi:hypothetical protein